MNEELICFSGVDFTNFIMFVKSMSSKDRDKSVKLALLQVKEGSLICKSRDCSSNLIEYKVDLYDGSTCLEDSFAVSINDMAALIKCANGNVFKIRKSFGQYEFNIIGDGWLPFKTAEADESKFMIFGNEVQLGSINSTKLKNNISFILGYTQECTYARDKYIRFNSNSMVATSRLSSVIVNDSFPEMTLHRDDAAMLKNLLKDNFDLKVFKVEDSVERIKFSGQKFNLTIVAANVETVSSSSISDISGYITVECDDLYKLTSFAEEYSSSKHIIGMSIKDNSLNISIKNVLAAKHNSKLNAQFTGVVENTTNEAGVPTHNLLKALRLFQDKHSRSINIYITNKLLNEQNCIILFDDNTQAKINIYNR